MAASSKKPSPLDQLLARYVDTYFGRSTAIAANSAVAPEHPDQEPPGFWHRETKRFLRDVAAEIYEKHLIGAPFRGTDEVSRVLERVLPGAGAGDSLDKLRDEEVDKICGRLLAALRSSARWEFDVTIADADAANVDVDLPIGGDSDLALYTRIADAPFDRFGQLHLRGVVEAHDGDGARVAIEELGATILGGAAALGIVVPDASARDSGPNEVRPLEGSGEVVRATALWWKPFSGSRTDIPGDLSDLERHQFDRAAPRRSQGLSPCIANRIQFLKNMILTTDARADAVRNACRTAHAAGTTRDYGLAITLSFAVIEGLLLEEKEKDSTVARLAEAVAHSLGRTATERNELRKRTKALYNDRCSFIHSGGVREKAQGRRETIAIMNRVLRREIESLAPNIA